MWIFYKSCLLLCVLLRGFTQVRKNRIFCTSYHYKKYSCNPRYITEFLLKEHPGEYEIYWCFKKNIKIPQLPEGIKVVTWPSLKFFYVLNTSAFIFSNSRLDFWDKYYKKRKEQKYIMTWHSSMGVKKVEKDAVESLSQDYIEYAKRDSLNCDLILAGCELRANIIRTSFWYYGEILKKGTPRNDMLFTVDVKGLKKKIYSLYHIPTNAKILLYAPTFRSNHTLDYYKFDWRDVVTLLNDMYGEEFCVLLRLHPNLLDIVKIDCGSTAIDVTRYHDMHELLCISDILVTDYSSSMFDFALLNRPCFIYATDYTKYDRGVYMDLHDTPFPFAQSNAELLSLLKEFDVLAYQESLIRFNHDYIGSYEKGKACEGVYQWMNSNNAFRSTSLHTDQS